MKYCKKCNTTKPFSDFGKDNNSKDKLNRLCKTCSREQSSNWWRNNKSKKRDANLRYEYGITLERFEELKAAQNNSCAVCNSLFSDSEKACVDHCHTTNKVRGLLCHNCNRALGLFKDSLHSLNNAIKYLEINKGELK
jgi:hypothetical protein